MIKRILEKWFGLSPVICERCETLRELLDKSERERVEILHRLLDKEKPEPLSTPTEEMKPIPSQFVPWRVKQQMLEAEDRVKARLLHDKAKEIAELEKEVGISEEVNA